MNQHRNSVSASYKRTQGVRSLHRIHWSSVCCPKTVKEAEYVKTTHGNQGEAAVEVGPVDLQRELFQMTSFWKEAGLAGMKVSGMRRMGGLLHAGSP